MQICCGPDGIPLHVYLLGMLDFDESLRLQRRLVAQVAADPTKGIVVLCEHPPSVSMGREGSSLHLRIEREELAVRGWPLRWVNRGGGCLLHLPGQLAIYPILPLQRLGLGLHGYLQRLHDCLSDVLDDFSVNCQAHADRSGLWVGRRLIAGVGVAVRDWVSWYGAYLNVSPDLIPFRHVQASHGDAEPMTSLARERHGAVRMALVRQSVIEHVQEHFGFAQPSIHFGHPAIRSERVLVSV